MRAAKILCVILTFNLFSTSVVALEVFNIEIAPMSGHDALISLASQTNYDIIFGEGTVPQFEFEGESGQYSITQALDILLGRSDLTYSVKGRYIRIVRSNIKTTALPKITVTGYLRDAASRVSQNEDSQETFPLYQLPLSILSVTGEHIDDVEARDIDDVLSYVSGIEYFELASGIYPHFYSRGVPALFSIDGKFYRRTLLELDPAVLERVDVIQGPSANYIQPGGMLNLVTKKPMKDSQYSAVVKAGSYDYYRSEFDFNFSAKSENKKAFRFIGVAETSNHVKDFVFSDKYVLAPSLEYEFSDQSQVLMSAYHQVVKKFPHTFTFHESFSGGELPREQIVAAPWSTSTIKDSTFGLDFLHGNWKNWRLSAGLNMSYANTDVSAAMLLPVPGGAPGDAVFQHLYVEDTFTKSKGADGAAEKSYSFLGVDALVRIGLDYQRFENSLPSYFTTFFPGVYNVQQTDYYALEIPETPNGSGGFQQKSDFYGVSVAKSFFVNEKFAIHADVRYEDMNLKGVVTRIRPSGTTFQTLERGYNELTPQLGANIVFTNSFSSHLSYSESFTNQTTLVLAGLTSNASSQTDSLSPVKTRQLEGAFKKTWLDEQLVSSLTFYRLKSSNIHMFDFGVDAFASVPADDQYSKGVDLSVSGQVGNQLNLIVNMGYNDNNFSLRDFPGADIGYTFVGSVDDTDERLHSSAKRVANAWFNYDIDIKPLNDFELGLGFKYVGDRFADDANSLKLPAYTKADAVIRYKGFSHLTLSLAIRNLFDKEYIRSSYGTPFFMEEGEPRSLFFSIKTTGGF